MSSCSCCNPAVVFSNKQAKYYHLKVKSKMEQASASKMQKVATSGRAEELVNTHIGTLANAVVKDGMVYGDVLELTLGLVEADFDDVRTATVDYCSSQISSINHDLLIEKTAIKKGQLVFDSVLIKVLIKCVEMSSLIITQ